ncbi:hypothetical protein CRM22_004708 [Opisthorchis felineus]|uniref:C2H2-type domain-containing protein n=1 Tax=Opisthorchis felineus TaxID=147828 RepID=A0A4S2LVZ2_OPIFE|nr:hypothetical protein CRM22_004708 [Opisthorchis felineus]
MDHSSYCGSAWTLGMMEPNGTSLSDLLTDHTYALQPFSSSAWTTCLESDRDWSPDAARPSQAETPPVNEDCGELNQQIPHVPYLPLLDRIFSRVELCIHEKADLDNLTWYMANFESIHFTQPFSISGRPSDIFRMLLNLASNKSRAPRSPEQSPCLPESSFIPSSEDISPIHVTLIQTHLSPRKCRRRPKPATYTCPHCQTTFSRKFAVTEHIRMIHDRKPKYRCSYCDHGFKRPALLRDHVYSKHARIHRFTCAVCHKGFIRKPDLLRHHLQHHKEQCSS